ncbi:hypothetical protein [Clostridium beijerinckii]|uniref:Uncharacterized protein n=1 Tax=Clostridium beijerinckii TaxID=1520 RepID=A0A1S8S138_CLOBE|nr:hypothetical protein [Clostridium beijerinckii]NRY64186.1 hypothetical protein [Clostridium beijerinckii]OOM59154.1 hypothetical protein CLBCK_36050 [Clostridium beijerinckii]
MQNKLDQLFVRLAKLFTTIEEKGLIQVRLIEEKDIIDKFYNKSVSMVLDGRIPEHIDLILSFELAKSIRDNLDDETIKCLILIKKLIEPIRNLEYYNIIEFAKVWASTEVYHEINDKVLQKYVQKDFENA